MTADPVVPRPEPPGRGAAGVRLGQEPAVVLLTGIQAAGKSTVGQALAERLPRSVHVRGDVFRRMVVNGRADMSPDPSAEALRQLRLRYHQAAVVSDGYVEAGFTVVLQDVVLGEQLTEMTGLIRSRPLLVVVLTPDARTVAARDAARDKHAYDWFTVDQLDRVLREHTPRIGLWLDTSRLTVAQTVDEILARAPTEAVVTP